MKSIKDRNVKEFIPSFNDNLKKKEKNQIVVMYHPMTLGEFERYSSNQETVVERIFINHITFKNLKDGETKEEILTGSDLMESTYGPLKLLLSEVYNWILTSFFVLESDKKN